MTHPIGQFFTHERVGGWCYYLTSQAVGFPINSLIGRLHVLCFPKETPTSVKQPTLSYVDQFKAQKISTKSELLERIFTISLNLLAFVPVTIITKQLLNATRFAELEMIQTPLLLMLQNEVISVIQREAFTQGLLFLFTMQE